MQTVRSLSPGSFAPSVTLILLMHGLRGNGLIAGRIHSAARPRDNPRLDLAAMAGDPTWNPPYLLFGWLQRNRNQHYRAFVEQIRNFSAVTRVHIYGCRIGDPLYVSSLSDFTADVGNFLRIIDVSDDASDREKQAAPDSQGVRQDGANFRLVTLRVQRGPLLGWQMRGRLEGRTVAVDLLARDGGNWIVRTFRPNDLFPAETAVSP
jgi:hypothetical protein